jgi:myo-inositol-1(or 4)-monophosphatase
MLAHGLTDLVIESGLNSYDIQALIPIVTAAGGIITAWDGGPADQGGRIIAAGDSRVHAQACQMLCDRLARTEG